MTEAEALQANLQIIAGRVDALHAFCLTLARTLPREMADKTGLALQNALPKVEAGGIASPISDRHLDEMLRVARELQSVMQMAAQGK